MSDQGESSTQETIPPTFRRAESGTDVSALALPPIRTPDPSSETVLPAALATHLLRAEPDLTAQTILPPTRVDPPVPQETYRPAECLETIVPPVAPSTALARQAAATAPTESLETILPGSATRPPSPSSVPAPAATEKQRPSPFENLSAHPKPSKPAGPPGFEMMKELGRGAMGVVYKARQIGLNRLCALKMILGGGHASDEEIDRFRNEAAAIARLSHPAIVQVYEIGEHGGMPYFAMEYCPGGSLSSHTAGHPLNSQRAAQLLQLLAEGMHHAHQANIIHRDLKPANVLAVRLDESGRPIDGPSDLTEVIRGSKGDLTRIGLKIADFGLARMESSGNTRSGDLLGTPSYMAPEQAAGRISEVCPGTDVWALGAILYDLLTGRPPFRGSTVMETVSMVIEKEPVPLRQLRPDVPRDLETICHKCLQKDRSKRYTTAKELADDLTRFLEGKPIQARPIGFAERAVRWAKRSPFQAVSLAAGVALVLATLFGLYGLYAVERLQGEAQRRDLAEERRLSELRDTFAALYASAKSSATDGAWNAVERDASTALQMRDNEPGLSDHPLAESLIELRDRARGELASAKEKAEARARLTRLQTHHGDAVVFASDFTGMEAAHGLERTRQAVAAGLALFGIEGQQTRPTIDPRFFSRAEVARIADRCHELFLLEADALARPVPGEPTEDLRARLNQALTRLDQASRVLGEAKPTRGVLSRRARYLAVLGDEAEAERVRQEAERTPPRLGADYFLAGLDRYREEDHAGAAETLAVVLRDQPDHYGAEYLLALCRLQLKQFPAGHEGLTRCLQMRPTFAWPRLLRGYASIELKKWDEARADFDAVLRAEPDKVASYVARVNRGVLALRQRKWSDSADDLKAAIAMRPQTAAAYINLALVHRQRAEMPLWQHGLMRLAPQSTFAVLAVDAHQREVRQQAVTVLDDAVKHCPRDARLYHERGRLCLLLEQRQKARDDFARAIELSVTRGAKSSLADDLIELGRLLHQEKRHEEAVRAYQAAAEVRPDRATSWRLMAHPLLALKRYDEAGAALDKFIATVPVAPGKPPTGEQARTLAEALKVRGLVFDEQARAFRESGAIRLHQRDLRGALDSYTQGLKFARDPELLALRGWTYLACNSSELAHADFDEALKLSPAFADARIGRATARIRLGKLAEGIEDVEAGVKAIARQPRPLYNAARVYAQAASALRDSATPKSAERSERRAAELLAQALEAMPSRERSAFWKNYVKADKAFAPIRRAAPMTALAAKYER